MKLNGHSVLETPHFRKHEIIVKNHESDPSISCEVDLSFVPENSDHLEGKNQPNLEFYFL